MSTIGELIIARLQVLASYCFDGSGLTHIRIRKVSVNKQRRTALSGATSHVFKEVIFVEYSERMIFMLEVCPQ